MKKRIPISIILCLVIMAITTACTNNERANIETDIRAVDQMAQALKVAAVDPSLGFPPDTISLTWKCGGDGAISVTPSDYESYVQATVTAQVTPESEAAGASGASVTIVVDTKNGSTTVTSSNITDAYFLELLSSVN